MAAAAEVPDLYEDEGEGHGDAVHEEMSTLFESTFASDGVERALIRFAYGLKYPHSFALGGMPYFVQFIEDPNDWIISQALESEHEPKRQRTRAPNKHRPRCKVQLRIDEKDEAEFKRDYRMHRPTMRSLVEKLQM